MSPAPFIIFIVATSFLIALIFFVREKNAAVRMLIGLSPHKGIEKLAKHWGLSPVDGGVTIERGGITFRVRFQHGGKNTPHKLILSTGDVPAGELIVRRENWRDAFGKWIGLNREFDTGDPAFDRFLYIESDEDEQTLLRLLSSPGRRDAMRKLIDGGLTSIHYSREEIRFVVEQPRDEDFAPDLIESRLSVIRDVLRDMAPLPATGAAPSKWKGGITASVCSGMFFFGAILGLAYVRSSYRPIEDEPWVLGLLLGIMAWFALQPFLVLLLKGHSTSLRHFLVASLILLPAMTLSGSAGVVGYNGAADSTPLDRHDAEILDKRKVRHKNSWTYYVGVRSWIPGKERMELTVDAGLYDRAAKGMPLIVTTRAGAFGWEWIVSRELGRGEMRRR